MSANHSRYCEECKKMVHSCSHYPMAHHPKNHIDINPEFLKDVADITVRQNEYLIRATAEAILIERKAICRLLQPAKDLFEAILSGSIESMPRDEIKEKVMHSLEVIHKLGR